MKYAALALALLVTACDPAAMGVGMPGDPSLGDTLPGVDGGAGDAKAPGLDVAPTPGTDVRPGDAGAPEAASGGDAMTRDMTPSTDAVPAPKTDSGVPTDATAPKADTQPSGADAKPATDAKEDGQQPDTMTAPSPEIASCEDGGEPIKTVKACGNLGSNYLWVYQYKGSHPNPCALCWLSDPPSVRFRTGCTTAASPDITPTGRFLCVMSCSECAPAAP